MRNSNDRIKTMWKCCSVVKNKIFALFNINYGVDTSHVALFMHSPAWRKYSEKPQITKTNVRKKVKQIEIWTPMMKK